MLLSNLFTLTSKLIEFIVQIGGLVKSSGNSYINYISGFNILNSSNESLCGGLITSSQALYILNRDNTKGSFATETGGSVFFWHHSKNMLETIKSGLPDSRIYNGSETLNLYFTTALTVSNIFLL